MPGELLRNVLRRRRVMREVGEDGAALIVSALGVELAQDCLLAGLMQALVEKKLAAMRRISCVGLGPTGQDLGKARYVGLHIAAVHAEGMELEDFADKIFVEPLGVTAIRISAKFPSAWARIASRSNAPTMAMSLSAEMQKWLDQNHTRRSAKPMSAPAAAS